MHTTWLAGVLAGWLVGWLVGEDNTGVCVVFQYVTTCDNNVTNITSFKTMYINNVTM